MKKLLDSSFYCSWNCDDCPFNGTHVLCAAAEHFEEYSNNNWNLLTILRHAEDEIKNLKENYALCDEIAYNGGFNEKNKI